MDNNEIQDYIEDIQGTDTCALITDGTLKIIARKKGNNVLAVRLNTIERCQYGFFKPD